MAGPFSPTGIDHVVFLVDGMARALRFYQDVLGCVPGYSYPAMGIEQVWAYWFCIRDPFENKLEIKGPAEYPDGR
ncbi:VOC family protein [Yoonia sp. BS5-3]|uniref:VOC family protein n=1 Tax=Yoonia phaeophyticola TaxID=3137369 RepID=A0ABZ2VAW4_9RHOB